MSNPALSAFFRLPTFLLREELRMSDKKANYSSVIDYMKKFLSSNNRELMDCCYAAILDGDGGRYNRRQIPVLNDKEFDDLFPLVSSVILTANKIECDSLNYMFGQQEGASLHRRKHPLSIFSGSDFGAPEAYMIQWRSSFILHFRASETGANTPGGSTDLVRYVSRHQFLFPSSIISFGICYGRKPGDQDIGDVIIPKRLYPWSIGQKISEKGFKIKNDEFNLSLEEKFASSGIYSSLREFCNDEDGRRLRSSVSFPSKRNRSCSHSFSVKATLGNMSTGEAVISSARAKKLIQEAMGNEKELGGEMEGYGLAKECIYYAQIPCLIVKAICDWGEAKNIDKVLKDAHLSPPLHLKDKLQAYAAFCAGIVLTQLLEQEKEALLPLYLIRWMGDQTKSDAIGEYDYANKEDILKHIKKLYNVKSEAAQPIFEKLEQYQFIKLVKNGTRYYINRDL